jgi:hypothetical protein
MTRISYINELYGQEELKRLQRLDARFINSAFMVTLLGAGVADQLEDGRVLSGVGGQYNFVAQGHALQDARSMMILRSWREVGRRCQLQYRLGVRSLYDSRGICATSWSPSTALLICAAKPTGM